MNCVRCGREDAVITLPYNGDCLGPRCFADFFERRVRKTIRTGKLLRFDDTVAVALSSGVSSSVLLYVLSKFSSDKPTSRVFAVTVDEGGGRVDSAVRLCKGLSVEHHVFTVSRGDRQAFLTKKVKVLGATKLAFGVNLDDEVMESLTGFLNGNLLEVYKTEKMEPVPAIRPLRECPIEEIRTYAKVKNIGYTKKEHKKNEVEDIIAKLEEKHPGSRFQILASTDALRGLYSKIDYHGEAHTKTGR